MSFCAVIDKRRFEAGLDSGDYCLVNIALFLFFCGRLNVKVNEFLTINNGDTKFFGLCRVKQHTFHIMGSRAQLRGERLMQAATD